MPSEESLELLHRIEGEINSDQPRLKSYVASLRDSVEADRQLSASQTEALAEFKDAYEKLTQPANRLATFLEWSDEARQTARIILGETEYHVRTDPKLDADSLLKGTRVLLNEAYAIIGSTTVLIPGPVVKVSEVTDSELLRVGSDTPGQDSRLVLRGASLVEVKIQPGDEVILDTTGKVALKHIAKTGTRDYFLDEIAETPWSAVGGQHDAIRLIKETIEQPLLHPEIFKKFEKKSIKGVLLYGPPGCGKTLLGKATAHNIAKAYSDIKGKEVKDYFMTISGPKILNMWVGETERMVREIFATARAKAAEGYLVIIFVDEAEAILRTRSTGRYFNMSNTVVPQFCAELDGIVALENVVLMLTSNRPDTIDPAVLRPGRIDRRVKVSRPDKESALQILGIYLNSQTPLDPELLRSFDNEPECARKHLIESTINSIYSKDAQNEFATLSMRNGTQETLYTFNFASGAILASIVDRAKDFAIRRAVAAPNTDHGLTLEDMDQARKDEFKESEIFPKSDALDDWIQLLDFTADQVVSIKPKPVDGKSDYRRRNVI